MYVVHKWSCNQMHLTVSINAFSFLCLCVCARARALPSDLQIRRMLFAFVTVSFELWILNSRQANVNRVIILFNSIEYKIVNNNLNGLVLLQFNEQIVRYVLPFIEKSNDFIASVEFDAGWKITFTDWMPDFILVVVVNSSCYSFEICSEFSNNVHHHDECQLCRTICVSVSLHLSICMAFNLQYFVFFTTLFWRIFHRCKIQKAVTELLVYQF